MAIIEALKVGNAVANERAGSRVSDIRRFLQTLVEATPDCIKVVAADGRLLLMNTAGLRMIEAQSFERVDGACTFDLIAPEHGDLWRAHHERVCRGETLVWQFDLIGLAGARRTVETHAAPLGLEDGTVAQLAIVRDISKRIDVQQSLHHVNEDLEEKVRQRTRALQIALDRLQETERSFELLVTSVIDYAIFMLDPAGQVVSWNAGARRIKGYDAQEIIGRNFSCFYTEEDRQANRPSTGLSIAAREGRFESEGWRVRKDGSRFWANVIVDAIHDGGKLVGFAKITRDITEKKAAEARLRQAQKMEVVGQFTGGAAHDFSNLLMAICGSLELLRKRLPDEPRMLALLDNAMQGAKRGVSLTQRMLAFARRQELKLEAVDIVALIGGMRELLERSVGAAVLVETRLSRQIPHVRTDANQLESALLNLVLNARDAMPAGGTVTISACEVSVDLGHPTNLPPGPYTCISVRDTGHGMDEATLARVTEPFFTTKGVGKGTGLGLSMVDGLAEQSGGKLMLQSKPEQGTKVEIWLPVAEAASTVMEPADDSDLGGNEIHADRLIVLAVDDDSLVLASTTAMLEDLGHKVIDVASGAKALEIVESGADIDLVISDQAMPGMTGSQLASAIKARRPQLPVILATGYAELPLGTDPEIFRLAKPFTQRELADALIDSGRRDAQR
jgi:PAS domain S-box-containing protein